MIPDGQLARVDELIDAGRTVEATDLLATLNARERDPALEIRLVDLRARAAATYEDGAGRSPWPPVYIDPFPNLDRQIPEIDASQLTSEVLAGSIAHHGSLLVRNVLSAAQAGRVVETIDHAHLVREQVEAGTGADDAVAWYRPLPSNLRITSSLRKRVENGGGIWLADSPIATAQIFDGLAATHVIESVRGHFGERPVFSLQKSTLRRVPPVHKFTSWHQDGSFLDADVRSMNLWLALSHCGGDQPTPALEVVPKRVPEILPVDNVMANYAISFETVAETLADTPTVVPEFAPGDALMFDERCLHRTHLKLTMTRSRYALECWMFAPSHQSSKYTPLLI